MTPEAVAYDLATERAKRERREFRRMVQKSDFTSAEKEMLLDYINLWITHRNKLGYIHPGRDLTAKRRKRSIKTVSRARKKFAGLGFMKPIAYQKGGTGKATCYTLDLDAIREWLEPFKVVTLPGELVPFRPRQTGTFVPVNVPVSGGQNVPLSKEETLEVDPEREDDGWLAVSDSLIDYDEAYDTWDEVPF